MATIYDDDKEQIHFKMYNNTEMYTYNNKTGKIEGHGKRLDVLNMLIQYPDRGNPFLNIKNAYEGLYTIEYHDNIDRSEHVKDQW